MRFPHLAQRMFNTPLAITADKAEIIMAALADRLGIAHLFHADGTRLEAPRIKTGEDMWGDPIYETPYDLVQGVAVIPVQGTVVHRAVSLRPRSGMTGYNSILLAVLSALQDKDAKAIMLDIDSPGGEVSGCFDLVDTIAAARGQKPIWSIVDDCACSAAYAIASAADRIILPRTGKVGSIGVIWMHVDWSRALNQAGIAVTFVTYGDRKTDGWPELPLAAEARERIQAQINQTGELFVQTVARNRNMTQKAVRETQAATYQGAAGAQIGLVDAIMAPDEAFARLLASLP